MKKEGSKEDLRAGFKLSLTFSMAVLGKNTVVGLSSAASTNIITGTNSASAAGEYVTTVVNMTGGVGVGAGTGVGASGQSTLAPDPLMPPALPPRFRFRDLLLGDYLNDDGER